MGFVDFLNGLLYEGNAAIDPRAPISNEEKDLAGQMLLQFDRQFRTEYPEGLPELQHDAAVWAAQAYYAACQFAMFRELEPSLLESEFTELAEPGDTPANHYSVHLVFRYLPDLVRTCRSISSGDPLTQLTEAWACRWPLSSIGLGPIEGLRVASILQHPALRKMYIESVIKQQDMSRTELPEVAEGVCIALGASHPWARKLRTSDHEGRA